MDMIGNPNNQATSHRLGQTKPRKFGRACDISRTYLIEYVALKRIYSPVEYPKVTKPSPAKYRCLMCVYHHHFETIRRLCVRACPPLLPNTSNFLDILFLSLSPPSLSFHFLSYTSGDGQF